MGAVALAVPWNTLVLFLEVRAVFEVLRAVQIPDSLSVFEVLRAVQMPDSLIACEKFEGFVVVPAAAPMAFKKLLVVVHSAFKVRLQ